MEAQPVDIPLDGLDIFGIFLGRVRIVKAQVALAAEFFRGQEVHDQGLAVADMHISVGFGRETGVDLRITLILQILLDRVPDKVAAGICLFHGEDSF